MHGYFFIYDGTASLLPAILLPYFRRPCENADSSCFEVVKMRRHPKRCRFHAAFRCRAACSLSLQADGSVRHKRAQIPSVQNSLKRLFLFFINSVLYPKMPPRYGRHFLRKMRFFIGSECGFAVSGRFLGHKILDTVKIFFSEKNHKIPEKNDFVRL